MTLAELKTLLETTGYPVAYHHFVATPEAPLPNSPYIVYLFVSSDNFKADDRVYLVKGNYQVELYTSIKDMTAEENLESILNGEGLCWEKSELYIESEALYQVVYSIQIIER